MKQGFPYSIIVWFSENTMIANLVMFFLIFSGIYSFSSIQTDLFPVIDTNKIEVRTVYPGMSSKTVEQNITRRLEEAILKVDDVIEVTSYSSESMSRIEVEYNNLADDILVLNDINSAIDGLQKFPPANAESPTVEKIEAKELLLSFALVGDSVAMLANLAKGIQEKLLSLSSISDVKIKGHPQEEISIYVDEKDLEKYQMSFEEIQQSIQNFSFSTSASSLRSQNGEIFLSIENRKTTGEEFQSIPIKTTESGNVLYLRTIASIEDGFQDRQFKQLIDGENALILEVYKRQSSDLLQAHQSILQVLQSVALPENSQLFFWEDRSRMFKERANLLIKNALIGFLSVLVVLVLFLNVKIAFWVSMGIPIAFLGGIFIASSIEGLTLNMITLFAFLVVLGIVVDDAIISGEAISKAQEMGKRGKEAVSYAIEMVFDPVLLGVMTTIGVFIALTFIDGEMGLFLRPVPIIVVATLVASMIEAFLILPSHLVHSANWSIYGLDQIREKISFYLSRFVSNYFIPILYKIVRFRYVFVMALISLFFLVIILIGKGVIKTAFFPIVSGSQVKVYLTMPEGTPFQTTNDYAEIIKESLLELSFKEGKVEDLIENVSVIVGGTDQVMAENKALVTARLVDASKQFIDSYTLEKRWAESIRHISNVYTVNFISSILNFGPDIEIQLFHPNEEKLKSHLLALKQSFSQIEGVFNIEDSISEVKDEFTFSVTPYGHGVGITLADIAKKLRQSYYGIEIDRLQRGREEIKVMLHYGRESKRSLADLSRLKIQKNGQSYPLLTVAMISKRSSDNTIKRVDGMQVMSVSMDVNTDILPLNLALLKVEREFLNPLNQTDSELSYQFAGGTKEESRSMESMKKSISIFLIAIFIILVGYLRSYAQPMIVLITIPFGSLGAILGHVVMDFELTFLSTFGVAALSGVLINDAIVFIYGYRKNLAQNKSLWQSIEDTVKNRFRPILLTTLTTSLGILPILYETSVQAQFLKPMAISLVFGILFSTLIILCLIPCLLYMQRDSYRLYEWASRYICKLLVK